MAGLQFVFPEPLVTGEYGVVKVPEQEITDETQDALVVSIEAGNDTQEVTILGGIVLPIMPIK